MKLHDSTAGGRYLRLGAALAGLVLGARAASAAPGKAPATAGPAAADTVVPVSVFVMPSTPQEGRDPFFPRSMRPYASAAVRPNIVNAAPPTIDLILNGLSGTADHPLAIINNRTFGVGEDGEVVVNGVHVHIRCLEIKAEQAMIQIGTERRVIHLRPGT